jgi:hypothetical protein
MVDISKETYDDILMHHGILGQKWGVRRFQNPDGTLTYAGKKRYSKLDLSVQRSTDRIDKLKKRSAEKPEYSPKLLSKIGVKNRTKYFSKNYGVSEEASRGLALASQGAANAYNWTTGNIAAIQDIKNERFIKKLSLEEREQLGKELSKLRPNAAFKVLNELRKIAKKEQKMSKLQTGSEAKHE